ncbi:MAG: PAS-domain containing protein [Sulfitobacter sp.]
MLFDKGILHHTTESAATLLGLKPGEHDWSDMRDMVLARFPDFPKQPGHGEHANLSLTALDDSGPQSILIRQRGNLTWVTLAELPQAKGPFQTHDDTEELDTLRRVTGTTPNPIWQEDADGVVRWHNAAYAALFKRVNGTTVDPRKTLFSKGGPTQSGRVILEHPSETAPDWYEITGVPAENITVFHANPINAVVAAEVAQRNFVQTLAKTFANLSIGLAIFDRKGQLALFNPALLDLTGLPAPFLSARPAMLSFFDALRENRRMPEPKNYRSWRLEIADVIAAATDGRYQETWTLETGQTYSVKGRQHPDGATAFLIEDISAEMTLTRNFRTELEQAQIMVDAAEHAMAIFSPTGVLTLCNAAFRNFWAVDPDAVFADFTLQDCARIWKESCAHNADRNRIDDELTGLTTNATNGLRLRLHDGTTLRCDVVHIPSGSLLVRFHTPHEAKRTATVRQIETT